MTEQAGLHGVLVALVTPVDEAGGLDTAALERIVRHVVVNGGTGVCPVGSTGEGPRLTRAARRRVVDAVRAVLPDGMPLVPGVPGGPIEHALGELEELAASGASTALVGAPAYFPMNDDQVEAYFTALAESSDVPLLLYNIPAMTKVALSPAVVGRLAKHPRIAGIKDSSRDLEYLQAVLYATAGTGFSVLTGSDTMLYASLLLGAHGAIAASANLVPDLSVALYDAVQQGELAAARVAQQRLFDVVQVCRRGAPPGGWKAALELVGLAGSRLCTPGPALTVADRESLAADLTRLVPHLVSSDG